MEHDSLLAYTQDPANSSYFEPDESIPHPATLFS